MPPKRRRLKRKREHPMVEQWLALSSLSASISKIVSQEQQFVALLKQVASVTEHEAAHPEKQWFAPDVTFDEDLCKDVKTYVKQWLLEIIEHRSQVETVRNKSLQALRDVDKLNDTSLKEAALTLSDAETRLSVLEHIEHKWAKIVRHKAGEDLQTYTDQWLQRWLDQWTKISKTLKERYGQFQEVLASPLVRACFPESS